MKKLIAIFLCLCLTAGLMPALAEDAQPFTVQSTPIRDDNGPIGSMDLRFYADTPNIAYMGIKAYMTEMEGAEIAVTAQEDGTWAISRPSGVSLTANPTAGTLYAEDWVSFQMPEPPYIQKKVHIKDTDCEWTEITEVIFDDEPTPVTFDFAKYGISIYADDTDVYMPLAMLSALLEDISMQYLVYNGDTLFKYSCTMFNMESYAPGFYEGEKIQKLIRGETQRQEDQIRESYGELCFIVDYFYGHPGTAPLEASLREKGLDEALNDLPDGRGESIRQALHSADYFEYLVGMSDLINFGLTDGHTVFTTSSALMAIPDYQDVVANLTVRTAEGLMHGMNLYQALFQMSVQPMREQLWGTESYREYGNTAIISFDGFSPDEAAWHAWEEGKGEMPMDALGITYTGLEKAKANPEIKNIIFDLTLNGGGSQDLMQAIIGMVYGDVVFTGYNELTKQKMHANVKTDRNMDGVIDEKDKDVSYDFNIGVLTSVKAFSCGNLFPFLMQERGAVVIGERSGGGSCVVQSFALSDGIVFNMSSYQWHLVNTKGENIIEKGADPDIIIERIETPELVQMVNPYFPRLTPGDYTPFYDVEKLDQLMNEYFAQKEEPAA